MREEIIKIRDSEGTDLNVYKWMPVDQNVKAILQISHGMAEHAARYHYFAEKLCSSGFGVYAQDHRGHGGTAKCDKDLGYIADRDGFKWLVKDLFEVNEYIQKNNEDIPIILLGHSMGSFVAQRYIQIYSDSIDGVILSGSNGPIGPSANLGIILSYLFMKLKGRRGISKFLNNLTFSGYNNKFRPNKTNYDWLCRDEEEVDKYMKDKYCGFPCTNSFYYDFFKGIKERQKEENINKIPKDKPIFIISGSMDPVGEYSKGVERLYECYKKAGMESVNIKLYDGARHEILNETNKDEVIKDILKWIEKTVSSYTVLQPHRL